MYQIEQKDFSENYDLMEIYDKNLDVFWYIFFILINDRKDKFYADQKWKQFGHLEGSCEGEYSGPSPCLTLQKMLFLGRFRG